ncbi:MAG: restriction endonuclease subunit S, partial [Phocaeicola sp.]
QGTELIDNRFLFYYLKTVNFIPFLSGGDRAKLTKSKLIEIQIPIPPLAIQKEIVRILDQFDTLTSSISEGLPKEIELRTKQYEYYRDKLLTFPRAAEGTTN